MKLLTVKQDVLSEIYIIEYEHNNKTYKEFYYVFMYTESWKKTKSTCYHCYPVSSTGRFLGSRYDYITVDGEEFEKLLHNNIYGGN